jgi:hypothetical protein
MRIRLPTRRRRHIVSQMKYFSGAKYKKRSQEVLWKYARVNQLSM